MGVMLRAVQKWAAQLFIDGNVTRSDALKRQTNSNFLL